jgi:hypothetical protein
MGVQDPNQPSTPAGPSRTMVAVFVGLGVLGLLVGIGAARLVDGHGSSDNGNGIVAGPSTPDSIEAPRPAETVTGSPTPNYQPIGADPQAESDLDFGYLTKVVESGGYVRVSFDRANYYTGAEAKKLNGGVAPPDDYKIVNTNPMLRIFAIDPEASLIGTARLTASGSGPAQQLTLAQFLTNAQKATANNRQVPVWLRHTTGLTGQVTALEEQFIP